MVDIIKRLKEYNIDPIVIDPWANKQEAKLEYGVELKDISEAKEVDCIIVAVAHNKFKNFPLEDLNKLYKEFGRLDLVIAAYNGGSGNVNKWLSDYSYSKDGKSLDLIPFEETSMYVKKVTKNYKMYNKLYSKEG